MTVVASKGKWAQGIRPRNFHWVIGDRLAICERPGGYGANHRKVRRQEEIIWVREQGFTVVISTIPAPHNLHNYDELGVVWRHRPFDDDDRANYELRLFTELRDLLAAGAVDEVCTTTVPRLIGGTHPRITDGPPVDVPLRLHTLLEQDGTLLARWLL